MRSRRPFARWAQCALLAAASSCATSPVGSSSSDASVDAAESPQAAESLRVLRARFVVKHSSAERSVIAPGVVERFDRVDGRVRAVVPATAKRSVLRSATTDLPLRANSQVAVEDDTTHVALRFALEGAREVRLETADGIALYRGAYGGADVLHRAHAEGTEDFIAFEAKPSREELRYSVDVTHAAGLRLVSNTLEFLDEGGVPRLRVAPPWLLDARGDRREATLFVDGCAFDRDPRAPWGRPVTAPGAPTCTVRVTWSGVEYPAVLDPAWTTTGSMTVPRQFHTATSLGSGKVLVTGGENGGVILSSAELFDGTGSFAATSALSTPRTHHTATLLGTGKVLVAGGEYPINISLSSAEVFDGTGTFTATGSMTAPRKYHTATLLGSGKVLLAGGIGTFYLTSAELFDGTSTFTATGSMTAARWAHTATLLPSGKVLVAGGYLAGSPESTAELFDGTGTFVATGSMATARGDHTATLLGSGKVLIAGGNTLGPIAVSTAELFDGTGSFAATGSMSTARLNHTATLLGSGKVLVAGGNSGAVATELFDGTSFATTGSMSMTRSAHSASLLASGNVLVAGGLSTLAVSSAEIFALVTVGKCSTGSECVSGVCEDGNCCIGPCSGTCMTCLPVTGACAPVKNADDTDTCTGTSTCSASGACLLKPGQPTTAAAQCASGIANDGFCCSGPCSGTCQTCAGTGACVSVTNADDPDTCNGTKTCSASGACLSKNGQPATSGSTCASGFAADGFCCNTACNAACQACSAASKGSGADGTCGFVATGTDPRVSCPGQTCSGTTQENGHVCDGAGGCMVTTTTSCSPYFCNSAGTACLAAVCSSDANCVSTSYCSAGACLPKKSLGGACGAPDQCTSGFCVDGVCCDSACGTKCAACTAAATGKSDGTCAPVLDGKDPRTDCPGGACSSGIFTNNVCNGMGACRANSIPCGGFGCNAAGTACSTMCASDADCDATAYCAPSGACVPKLARGVACTTNSQCSSKYCADGVCCDTKCDGQCQACGEPGSVGTCLPVKGAPRTPRAACNGTDPMCAGQCNGVNIASCTYPSVGQTCGAGCTGGKISVCDATGVCLPPASCPGNLACDTVTNQCKSSCAGDEQCATGFVCTDGKCMPKPSAKCSAEGTATYADGTSKSCDPYRCVEGTGCPTSCATSADCVNGGACDTGNGVGVCRPAPGDTASSGGCAIGAPAPAAWGMPLAALALTVLVRRRRGLRSHKNEST